MRYSVLEAYRAHVAERQLEGIPPKPLTPEWTSALVELLKNPTRQMKKHFYLI
jgi:aconitate hydratase 2/2-methylisocitrate dehydratase